MNAAGRKDLALSDLGEPDRGYDPEDLYKLAIRLICYPRAPKKHMVKKISE